jgi:hypothetical protein
MVPSLIDGFGDALATVEKTNSDFSFGKPDESDFIRAILDSYGFEKATDEFLETHANVIFEDAGQIISDPATLITYVYGAAVAAGMESVDAPAEPGYDLDVAVDGGFPGSVERSFDAYEEAIEAIGEAIRMKENHPGSVVTLVLTKRV